VALCFANRVVHGLTGRVPAVVPALPVWQSRLASAFHVLLYVFMAVMPILGWLMLSAAGKPIPFFGLQLPAVVSENVDLARQLQEVHGTIGTAGYFIIGAHALAALHHHFLSHDNTLLNMLPRRS